MLQFIKVQAASILGSIADYLTTILLVEVFGCWYLAANLAGNICGGTIQFLLCRNWAFKEINGKRNAQINKFILVFIGNIAFSAAGVYLLTHYMHINYIISKTIISVLLGVSYNYILQKKYVFS